MQVDYEAEYNNRARVPEHPQILARMAKDAAAYRATASSRKRADLGVSYGRTPRQILDIFHAPAGGSPPLAMFIHGGYWRSLEAAGVSQGAARLHPPRRDVWLAREPGAFSQVAAGLNARGVTVALAGYDLCPQVGIGDIVEQIRQACVTLWRRTGKRILVFGHSAGAHLAATTLATVWSRLSAPPDLVPAAMAISGLFDLIPLMSTAMN